MRAAEPEPTEHAMKRTLILEFDPLEAKAEQTNT